MDRFTQTLVVLGLVAFSAGCQDVRAFVSGDPIAKAKRGVPRVEVELFVEFEDSLFEEFEDLDAAKKLKAEIADSVLGMADLGLRFYPVPTEEYGSGNAKPTRMMVVRFEELVFDTEHELVEEADKEPWVHSTIEGLTCVVSAYVGKRRNNAPTLVIGQDTGEATVRPSSDSEEMATYALRQEAQDHQRLHIAQDDVLKATNRAVVNALRGVTIPVDRELETAGGR